MTSWIKTKNALQWLPAYCWQRLTRWPRGSETTDIIISMADHFEPSIALQKLGQKPDLIDQETRLRRWCEDYPTAVGAWKDSAGQPFRHTYFFPAEQYHPSVLDPLAEHCHAGWGELEIHLHHGIESPDNAEATRSLLTEFRDTLEKNGCLSRYNGEGPARYAFVHGNWALANSNANRFCGVDNEMQILCETGCYADFTLPSAPNPAQVSKINSLYECNLPLTSRAPHRKGRDLARGRPPKVFPLIVQGPLLLAKRKGANGWPRPMIENGSVQTANPATLARLHRWRRANITVRGRPDWIFVKLHCHGMDPMDEEAMLGSSMQRFLKQITEMEQRKQGLRLHFVTCREMVNIALAACDGKAGDPDTYRDYLFKLITPHQIKHF